MKQSSERPITRFWGVVAPFLILLFVVGLFVGLLAWKDARNETSDLSGFVSLTNLFVILIQTVIVAIGALGMTMIIVSAGIDLSVGSVVALSSCARGGRGAGGGGGGGGLPAPHARRPPSAPSW